MGSWHRVRRCNAACWERRNINNLIQMWIPHALILTCLGSCAHWSSNGVIVGWLLSDWLWAPPHRKNFMPDTVHQIKNLWLRVLEGRLASIVWLNVDVVKSFTNIYVSSCRFVFSWVTEDAETHNWSKCQVKAQYNTIPVFSCGWIIWINLSLYPTPTVSKAQGTSQ